MNGAIIRANIDEITLTNCGVRSLKFESIVLRRPGQAKRELGPIATGRCFSLSWQRPAATTKARGYGSPEFTNEVQHFRLEVLPWGGLTSSSPLKTDARLPDFRPMAARCGKSRQLWIASVFKGELLV